MYLLTVAALLIVTSAVVIEVCCWPLMTTRSRIQNSTPPAFGPDGLAPPRRDDFTLTN